MRKLHFNIRHFYSFIGATGFIWLLLACATGKVTVGRPIPEDKISDIVIGKTTELEIISMFGAPDESKQMNEYTIYIYKYCKFKAKGVSTGYTTHTSQEEKCNELSVTFNKATNKVAAKNFNKRL